MKILVQDQRNEQQLSYFQDGSFVIHKLRFIGKSYKVSAWFGKDGTLKEAVLTSSNGKEKSLPKSWRTLVVTLENIGKTRTRGV